MSDEQKWEAVGRVTVGVVWLFLAPALIKLILEWQFPATFGGYSYWQYFWAVVVIHFAVRG